jgi:hypothetical protein
LGKQTTITQDKALSSTKHPFEGSFVSSAKEGLNIMEPCQCIADKVVDIENVFFKERADQV